MSIKREEVEEGKRESSKCLSFLAQRYLNTFSGPVAFVLRKQKEKTTRLGEHVGISFYFLPTTS